MHPQSTPEARRAALARGFAVDSGVVLSAKKGFDASAPCANDRIFAVMMEGRFVVKPPLALVGGGAS
jgi:hypothetical protein